MYNNQAAAPWDANHIVVKSAATMQFKAGGTGEFSGADLATILSAGTATGGFMDGSNAAIDTTNASGVLSVGTISNTNAMNLVKVGTGTLALTGNNTYTGSTIITAGILSVSSINAAGVAGNVGAGSGLVTFNGGTLQYTGAGESTDRTLTINAGLTGYIDVVSGSSNLTLTGSSAATTGGLTKIGLGTLTLTGSNFYTGATTISRGTLALDYSAGTLTTGILSDSSTLVLNGGTLAIIGGASGTAQTFANASFGIRTFSEVNLSAGAGGMALELGNVTRGVSSGLNVTVSGSVLGHYTGATTSNDVIVDSKGVAFMTIDESDWASLTSGYISPLTTYAANDFSSPANNVNVTTNGSGTSFTINTLRTNAASGATLTIDGTNTISTGGILVTGSAGAFTIAGTGTLTGSPSVATVAGQAATANGELNIFQYSANATTIGAAITNSLNGASFLTATSAGTTLAKMGGGTLILSSTANTYSGGTLVEAGTLKAGAVNVLVKPSIFNPVTVSTDATLDLAGYNQTIASLSGSGTVDNTASTNATLSVGTNMTAGSVVVTSSSTASTTVTVAGVPTALTVGATLLGKTITAIDGNTVTLSGFASTAISNATPTAFTIGDLFTFSGAIKNTGTGTLGLTKIGSNTFTLTGANTYTGATVVNAGTLKLDFNAATAPTSDIIKNSSALTLGSATLLITGSAMTATSQAFSGTTLTGGAQFTVTGTSATTPVSVSLGAIARTTTVGTTIAANPYIGGTLNVTATNAHRGYQHGPRQYGHLGRVGHLWWKRLCHPQLQQPAHGLYGLRGPNEHGQLGRRHQERQLRCQFCPFRRHD